MPFCGRVASIVLHDCDAVVGERASEEIQGARRQVRPVRRVDEHEPVRCGRYVARGE
jgi:hypothetical protein